MLILWKDNALRPEHMREYYCGPYHWPGWPWPQYFTSWPQRPQTAKQHQLLPHRAGMLKTRASSLGTSLHHWSGYPGTRLCSIVPQRTTPMGRTETQASRTNAEQRRCTSWTPRPEQTQITCWGWSFLSPTPLETAASFLLLVTSSIRSSHCSFTSFIWLIHWLLVKANGRMCGCPECSLLDPTPTVQAAGDRTALSDSRRDLKRELASVRWQGRNCR